MREALGYKTNVQIGGDKGNVMLYSETSQNQWLHKYVSWALIFILLVHVGPAVAHDSATACARPANTLEERLADISAEATCFLDDMSEPDRVLLRQQADMGVETAGLRARIQNLPLGQEVAVIVRTGEHFRGELAEAKSDEFTLWIKSESRSGRVKKTLQYQEVDSAVLPEWKGWMSPENLHDFKTDERLELLLTTGTKIKGRLSSISEQAVVVRLNGDERRTFDIHDVASVRKQGMQTWMKATIVVGIVVVALIGASYAALASAGG